MPHGLVSRVAPPRDSVARMTFGVPSKPLASVDRAVSRYTPSDRLLMSQSRCQIAHGPDAPHDESRDAGVGVAWSAPSTAKVIFVAPVACAVKQALPAGHGEKVELP